MPSQCNLLAERDPTFNNYYWIVVDRNSSWKENSHPHCNIQPQSHHIMQKKMKMQVKKKVYACLSYTSVFIQTECIIGYTVGYSNVRNEQNPVINTTPPFPFFIVTKKNETRWRPTLEVAISANIIYNNLYTFFYNILLFHCLQLHQRFNTAKKSLVYSVCVHRKYCMWHTCTEQKWKQGKQTANQTAAEVTEGCEVPFRIPPAPPEAQRRGKEEGHDGCCLFALGRPQSTNTTLSTLCTIHAHSLRNSGSSQAPTSLLTSPLTPPSFPGSHHFSFSLSPSVCFSIFYTLVIYCN